MDKNFKDEKVFGDKCVPSNHTTGSIAVDLGANNIVDINGDNVTEGSGGSHDDGHLDCTAQDQEFQRIFLIGYSLGMVLSFPLGLCLDRLGSVPTRLMAGLVYTLGPGASVYFDLMRTVKVLESAELGKVVRT